MLTLIAHNLSGPASAVVIEAATGKVWRPAARGFGLADGTSELIPLTPLAGSGGNIEGMGIATLPDFPDTRAPGQFIVSVHPASGGKAISASVLPSSQVTVAVAVSVTGG